ncbi:MAG: alpha-L-fucosidase [Pirellulaceae bacterium]
MENFFHPDWTNDVDPHTGQPDYSARQKTTLPAQQFDPAAYGLEPSQAPDFDRYVGHLKAQMSELTQLHGPFLAWWFDQRAPSWTHARGSDLYAYMRGLQPDVLLSHRIDTCYDRGLDNPTWFVTEGQMAGDYAQSEISVPRFKRDIAWEYCRVAGIEGTTWYWKPDDVYRPLNDWILDIVHCACRDGNFLLGIGPRPDGRFEPPLVDQLRQLGQWLRQYGESIYGTRGGPFMPTTCYGSTCRGNTVYVHLLKIDGSGSFTLPPIGRRILRSRLLNGGRLNLEQSDQGVTGTIRKQDLQPPDTIVVLDLDGSAAGLAPIEEQVLTADAKVSASSTRDAHAYGAEQTVDGDRRTYWTTDTGVTEGWLEFDLGKPHTFARAILDEGDDGWIRHVRIQAKIDDQWKTVFEYQHGHPTLWNQIPMELFCPEFKFEAVTAQQVKVHILLATQSPVVREFRLYAR